MILSDGSTFKLWESRVVYCVRKFGTCEKGKWKRERKSPLLRLLEADCCAHFHCVHFFLWFYRASLSLGPLLCLCIFVFGSLPPSSISVSVSVCLSFSFTHKHKYTNAHPSPKKREFIHIKEHMGISSLII